MNLLLRGRVIWFYAFRVIKVRLIYIKNVSQKKNYIKNISNNLIHRDHVSPSF